MDAIMLNSVLRLPVYPNRRVELRLGLLGERDRFNPELWPRHPLLPEEDHPFLQTIDLSALNLPDGCYEYEFVVDGRAVPDPFADEIVRFGGYRGVLHMVGGRRVTRPFSWEDEFTPGVILPPNEALVIYELPLRWVMAESPDHARNIGLGDFDHLIFAHLGRLAELGINCIELLPIQDSPDTLNWGYGTRFFFAPDIDLGSPVDTRFFVKRCHQLGIRVILDVVMNHARECPLEDLARDLFFLRDGNEEGGRPSWGGRIFRYRQPAPDNSYPARDFHYQMAEYWVEAYHMDGFRVDEFKGIDHWEFVQTFYDRAKATQRKLPGNRPFIVIAEDSWRRAAATQDRPTNPGGRKVVDSIWNFAFRDECRRLLRDGIQTDWGQPSRRDRIVAAISGRRMWDDLKKDFSDGINETVQAINYVTSHDVEEEGEQRFMNYVFGPLLRERGFGDGSVGSVRRAVEDLASAPEGVRQAHADALDRAGSAFALLMTAVGVPMLLAGEEFGDVHDLDHTDWRLKMSDPIDWRRAEQPGHAALRNRVRDLIALRTKAQALRRTEIEFFYFHPTIDENDGARVFAFCRTGGLPLGSRDQVVVVANCGRQTFPVFNLPWPWRETGRVAERGQQREGGLPDYRPDRGEVSLTLMPYAVRVFTTGLS